MTHVWQLQDASNRFSEVVEQAVKHGPPVITKRSVETAILLSVADYRKMLLAQQTLSDFFRASPLVGVQLDLARDRSLC